MTLRHQRIFCSALLALISIPLLRQASAANEGDSATASDSRSAAHASRPLSDILTIAANFDGGYRDTQLFKDDHSVLFFQGDSRLELWLPPFRSNYSWGPYLRLAGITSDRDPAFENNWQAVPGIGIQTYPFSLKPFRNPDSWLGKVFGPLRLFAEYNHQDYGANDFPRPDEQFRGGFDYYKALNVNDSFQPYWAEIYNQLIWQSTNEFDDDYRSWVFANSLRIGVRVPDAGALSMITPYLLGESSLTENRYAFENRLLVGGGLRLDPDLRFLPKDMKWLTRFVVYAEYVNVAAHYKDDAPEGEPDHDIRIGITFSIGDFYK